MEAQPLHNAGRLVININMISNHLLYITPRIGGGGGGDGGGADKAKGRRKGHTRNPSGDHYHKSTEGGNANDNDGGNQW